METNPGIEDLDNEARRAIELHAKRPYELTEPESRWLELYKAEHDYPLRDAFWVSRSREEDLGVGMGGWDTWGSAEMRELGVGNVHVAGGWCLRVYTAHDRRGWFEGWMSSLSGLSAFLEAMGVEEIEIEAHELGPFKSQDLAYDALCTRMLAALVLMSGLALQAAPDALAIRARQQAQHDAMGASPEAGEDASC